MKRLYGRLLLWLITPALEVKAQADEIASEERAKLSQQFRREWRQRSAAMWRESEARKAATADEAAVG